MSASTSETSAIDAIVELINGSDAGDWQDTKPEAYAYREVDQADRGPADGQPGHIYVWSPVDADLNAFDAEYSHIDERRTVEMQVWDLDSARAERYSQDLIDYISTYANDNEANTPFHRVRPTAAHDTRSETSARDTNYYVLLVEAQLRRFRNV